MGGREGAWERLKRVKGKGGGLILLQLNILKINKISISYVANNILCSLC